jgi:polyphenol oxidase
MRWRENRGVEWLEAELPLSIDGPKARAVFSTRSAGSAKEGHEPLASALGLAPEQIVSARQVHGTNLSTHQSPPQNPLRCSFPPDNGDKEQRSLGEAADGQVLTVPGPVGLVYVADCLPVALAGRGGVAILHCGWRGLAAGIVGRGTAAVDATHAAIGPGIGPCCYEVGDEVLESFCHLDPGVASDRLLDLPEVARRLLREAGVEEIESAGLCTRCEEERFFSHRRDGGPGRQAGLAWIEEER